MIFENFGKTLKNVLQRVLVTKNITFFIGNKNLIVGAIFTRLISVRSVRLFSYWHVTKYCIWWKISYHFLGSLCAPKFWRARAPHARAHFKTRACRVWRAFNCAPHAVHSFTATLFNRKLQWRTYHLCGIFLPKILPFSRGIFVNYRDALNRAPWGVKG